MSSLGERSTVQHVGIHPPPEEIHDHRLGSPIEMNMVISATCGDYQGVKTRLTSAEETIRTEETEPAGVLTRD